MKQGTRVVEEPIDNGKYESAFLPEIFEAAKKKCCAWFGVPRMSFWRIEQTSLCIMGWAFSEERSANDETEVKRSESAEWDSESELSDLDPWLVDEPTDDAENVSASDDEPVDDPQYDEIMESWDVWKGPCMCESKRPGLGCTSARCINDDVDEMPLLSPLPPQPKSAQNSTRGNCADQKDANPIELCSDEMPLLSPLPPQLKSAQKSTHGNCADQKDADLHKS